MPINYLFYLIPIVINFYEQFQLITTVIYLKIIVHYAVYYASHAADKLAQCVTG